MFFSVSLLLRAVFCHNGQFFEGILLNLQTNSVCTNGANFLRCLMQCLWSFKGEREGGSRFVISHDNWYRLCFNFFLAVILNFIFRCLLKTILTFKLGLAQWKISKVVFLNLDKYFVRFDVFFWYHFKMFFGRTLILAAFWGCVTFIKHESRIISGRYMHIRSNFFIDVELSLFLVFMRVVFF